MITINYKNNSLSSFEIPIPFLPYNFLLWFVTGHAGAESCFFIRIAKRNNKTTDFVVTLRFILCINVVNIQLLYLIQKYFGCGIIMPIHESGKVEYIVSNFDSIKNIIIPHFQLYKLRGTKYLNFCDWVKATEIISNEEHLTKEGMNKIISIKSEMNRSRKYPTNYQPNYLSVTKCRFEGSGVNSL